MRRVSSRTGAAAVLTVAALALAACSGGGTPESTASGSAPAGSAAPTIDESAPVTISISDLPTTENAEARQQLLNEVDAFQKVNPNITVDAQETVWAADTFQALLAGGTMPTVMSVPFTDIQSLIQRDQVADIDQYVADDPILSTLNDSLVSLGKDDSGHIRALPIAAYTMGLIYNRSLFTAAGLDPDKPPTTWDEVRADAKTIQEKTGVQGFEAMTTDNTGGWVLTTMSYAYGSTVVDPDDPTTATVDNDATKQALEFYKSLRWEDNTFGSNFLLNYGDATNNFAAGKAAMFVQGADIYLNAVANLGMKPEDVGIAPLPQDSDGIGTLGGGNVVVFNPTATPEQIAAGLKWIKYHYFEKYVDKDLAVAQAKATIADNGIVGRPELRIVGSDTYDQWLGWVKDYINVPRENFDAYLSTVDTLALVPEPARSGQEIYAALDSVVQSVLTQQDADVDHLLSDAQTTVQGILDADK